MVRADEAIFEPRHQPTNLLRVSPLAKINLIPGKCLAPALMVYFKCQFSVFFFKKGNFLEGTWITSWWTTGWARQGDTVMSCDTHLPSICCKRQGNKNCKNNKGNAAHSANALFFPHFLQRKRAINTVLHNSNSLAGEVTFANLLLFHRVPNTFTTMWF